ncbi:EAL domain-containing protein [Aurantimonas endophytica]|uniref:Diguanylate cyclase (GGDEF)-like protein/PAS domain S-box-containing protein n=1 Tax=Aurantimonas endophytica TaxID=1522175 RepID=A0A7W6HES9_9HYPH|nr:diguanylate cyclase (GGDEF)-like protein/PAS domain S-box-containing protein [Aurantimonas endophytica]
MAIRVPRSNIPDAFVRTTALEGLYRRWLAARVGALLPPYEDVALGSLGQVAEQLALIVQDASGGFQIVRFGETFRKWLGQDGADISLDELRPECKLALGQVITTALRLGEPGRTLAHVVSNGIVETYNVVAFPLESRWGPPVILACMEDRNERYSLVDTMFGATDEGMLALTAIRDDEGRPSDFQIISVNDGACRLLRRTQDKLQWKRLSEIDLMLEEYGVLAHLRQSLETGERRQFEISIPGEAATRHVKIGVSPVRDLLSVTLTDIAEVKAREASFRLLFDSNPVPMWLYDPSTLSFLQVNDAAVRHYGYSRDAFLGMSVLDIRPAETRETARAVLEGIQEGYEAEEAWRHVKADGSEILVYPYLRVLSVDERPAVLVAVMDVTERRKAEARIAHMAHHDALTNLPNRVLFRERLDRALGGIRQRDEKLAIFCVDLDHFKSVNDTLGHPIGDKLLQAVADRFRDCLGERDIVARLGGDEFAVIQPAVSTPAEASILARRLIEAVSAPYEIEGHQIVIGTSIGIALAPGDGNEPDVLLKNADVALYRAKADGRNTFHFFEQGMDSRLRARRALDLDLRNAMAAGEFELYYQPVITARSSTVSGFEALMRWHHRERGMVSPAEFIPMAEEIGLIVPLGEWALLQACREAATWPAGLTIAVNLSPVQFKSRNLVPAVINALTSSGLAASRLELEITESVLLQESEVNLATLHQLRELGVHISMDDFGTGYSSLGYLRQFPFDKIKIDQSFIKELAENPQDAAIVRAVTGLGISLGMTITAEGVETQFQFDRLRLEGCTEVQGYLFSPPRPASALGPFLTGRQMTELSDARPAILAIVPNEAPGAELSSLRLPPRMDQLVS